MRIGSRACAAWIALFAGAAACGSANASGGFEAPSAGSDAGWSNGGNAGDDGGAAPYDSGPPEKKVEGNYQSPVATGRYVWVANPTSGRVAYIDATTLDVRTVEAGDGPKYLGAIPSGDDAAIAINVLSHDATLLRTVGNGALSTQTFPLATDVNSWTISGDGRWAIAWGDASKEQNLDPTQGMQDISVLDLTGQKPATILAVGYRPVKVAFASDASRAFAVTQDGVSVVDLRGAVPLVTKNFPVSSDPNDDPGTRDVSITPDGAFAFVRRDNRADVGIVALSDGALTTVTLPANATDLTLSPDGAEALAVMRDTSTVAILPIPKIQGDPTSFATVPISGQTVGRAIVADDAKTTLLFTTVMPVDRVSILALPTLAWRTVKLYAPVLAVFPTHDAQDAIVLHDLPEDAGTSAKGAFSIVPVGADLPAKIVGTEAPPNAVAIAPSSDRAIVTVSDTASKKFGAYLAKMPSLEVDEYPLASPPIAAGVVVGAGRAYVAQTHPEGRITFIDLATGQARTLTGFELGSRIVDGSQP